MGRGVRTSKVFFLGETSTGDVPSGKTNGRGFRDGECVVEQNARE